MPPVSSRDVNTHLNQECYEYITFPIHLGSPTPIARKQQKGVNQIDFNCSEIERSLSSLGIPAKSIESN